ncbi:MAG: hypothetical protein JOS17DRAFT_91135 [Linnemannia elongata]|nr:MAG: hypothetical protein JOS17DRAFT_91135 [Linnemannia elongata]
MTRLSKRSLITSQRRCGICCGDSYCSTPLSVLLAIKFRAHLSGMKQPDRPKTKALSPRDARTRRRLERLLLPHPPIPRRHRAARKGPLSPSRLLQTRPSLPPALPTRPKCHGPCPRVVPAYLFFLALFHFVYYFYLLCFNCTLLFALFLFLLK